MQDYLDILQKSALFSEVNRQDLEILQIDEETV